jgi:endonuclease YncB( thermonuclease family)
MKQLLARVLLALALAAPATAATLQGTVTRVIDGDSLLFQPQGGAKPIELRLKDIDAPEGCQPGGPQAREFLQDYVRDKPVRVETFGLDGYGRTLAVLTVDEMNVNQRMVAEGHAWSSRTKWNQGPFVGQERMAQALKRGLHATPGAVMPSEFRKRQGPCAAGAASAPASAPAPRPAARAAEVPIVQAVADRCDGRTHCSQMRSCAEARYFLANCPGVKMDGDNDGIPCEQQWCR